ncbi:MAG: hypothetical protein RR253_07940, partial [Oscillospiraceae bacterium]
ASIFGFAMKNNVTDDKKLFIILALGPLINFLAALIAYLTLKITFQLNIYVFMVVNFLIFGVNMLPISYLDGGMLLSLIWQDYIKYADFIGGVAVAFMSVMVIYLTENRLISGLILLIFIVYYVINMIKAI